MASTSLKELSSISVTDLIQPGTFSSSISIFGIISSDGTTPYSRWFLQKSELLKVILLILMISLLISLSTQAPG